MIKKIIISGNNNNDINREKDVTPDFEKKNGKMQPTRTKTVLENTTTQKKRGKKQGIK